LYVIKNLLYLLFLRTFEYWKTIRTTRQFDAIFSTINNMPQFSELVISLHLPDSNLSLYVIREALNEITIVNFVRNAINLVKINFLFLIFL